MPDRDTGELDALRRARRLVAAADADRQALERALHDGLQQHLVALAMNVRRVERLLETDPPAAMAALEETVTIVQQAIDEAARLAQRIYPPLLEARGLAGSLRSAAADAGVRLSVAIDPADGYQTEITAALYWTCLGLISSARPETDATVAVHQVDGAIEFEVTRVGGYTAEQVDRLRDRIEALGGWLKVVVVGENVRVSGWLPAG